MKKQSFLRSHAGSSLCALLLTLLFCPIVFAQTGTSTVRGTVVDEQGRAIPGATVTLTNVEKSFTRTQTTKDTGEYSFPTLDPGTYQLTAESKGFKKETVTNVRALVDQPTDQRIQLAVGSVSETVTVASTGVDSLVNAQDATIGNNFVSQQITQLPLESQNAFQLLTLQPGVTQAGEVAGARSDQSNLTLDGVDVNEQQTGAAFESVLRVTPASVEEFRVTVTNPNATQGRSSGAQVSLVTKSGTNNFHGSLYEFHRNTIFEANDFFNNRSGIPREKLLRNVFGGTLGGPIKRDRLFFFYNYEGRRDASQRTVVHTVPLASLGAGMVRYPNKSGGITTLTLSDLNNLFPSVGMNPAAISLLASAASRYPANDFTVGDSDPSRGLLLNTAGFRFNAPVSRNLNTNIARLDWNVSKNGKHVVFLRGNYQADLSLNPTDLMTQRFPDTPAERNWSHPLGYVVGYTWTINSHLINTFRQGYTREAFSDQGDSTQNEIVFRGTFQPFNYDRTLSRTTPVTNFLDDVSWIHKNHTFQFGTNIRLIRNHLIDFSKAYDNASTNYFFYATSGSSLLKGITGIASGYTTPVKAAVSSLIGRFSQYTNNFNFNRQFNLQDTGAPNVRTFATESYDLYFQDSWKVRPDLTMTYGLRYNLSTPVYETAGYQTKPNISLSQFFADRVAAAGMGQPYTKLLTVDLTGPVNGRGNAYPMDKKNFQPRLSLAYSPSFKSGFWHKLFGNEGDSVIRGGVGRISDYFGQALAVQFERNNTLGFSSSTTIAANTYNASTSPGPQFTGLGMTLRGLPGIPIQTSISFPQQKPADMKRRIESSLDADLQTPVNWVWDLSFGRKLKGGFYIEASYLGRRARHLIAVRDAATPVDLADPTSGQTWYRSAAILQNLALAGTPISAVPNLAFFDHFYPGLGSTFADHFGNSDYAGLTPTQAVYASMSLIDTRFGDCSGGADWTSAQDCLDLATGIPYFYNQQYGALAAFSTIGNSIYHAGTITVRQRFKNKLTFDFNYTLSKSIDDASGLQDVADQNLSLYTGGGLIISPFNPRAARAVSDFDIRHIINANAVWQLPIGRHQAFFSNMNKVVDTIFGGWQLSTIFRYNSGLPLSAPFDAGMWSTNWEIESFGVRARPIQTAPNRGGANPPNVFGDPVAAYQSFRNSLPGENGDRNIMRLPGYIVLDAGLTKIFHMPWKENHRLELRWETFNVTNTQRMGAVEGGHYDLDFDPQHGTPAKVFGNFTGIQGTPRVMQFGLRYTF